MKKEGLEFKVGLFVIAAAALLFVLVYKTGDFTAKPSYTVRFLFRSVSGIDSGSPVRLSGVHIGDVKGVRVVREADSSTQVEVTARILQDIQLEEDAEVRINSMGIIGEKYVEIYPGTPGKPLITDGGSVMGRQPVAMEEVVDSSNQLIGTLEDTAKNLNEIVRDPEFKMFVKGSFGNAEKLFKNLDEAVADLKEASASAKVIMKRLENGEGSVGRLLKSDKLAKDFEDLAADLKAHPWKLLIKR